MKLSISSLAWQPVEDDTIADLLVEYRFDGIELAPTKLWPNLSQVSEKEVKDYRRFRNNRGLRIVAMQSLLFGRDELTIFDSEAQRDAGVEYFRSVFQVAEWLGARVLIYGSPRNRHGVDGQDPEIWQTAIDYFRRLGLLASRYGVCLCIEPLPRCHPCDFVINAEEGRRLVDLVGQPGFRLHLDSSSMFLATDDLEQVLQAAGGLIKHFHVSEPSLGPVHSDGLVPIPSYMHALARHGYSNWVSIEMLESKTSESNAVIIENSLEYLRNCVT